MVSGFLPEAFHIRAIAKIDGEHAFLILFFRELFIEETKLFVYEVR
jgi:hypothetical protein